MESVVNKPLDRESIAKAMKEAAWIAKHGTREQRAGRFVTPHASTPSGKPEAKQPRSH